MDLVEFHRIFLFEKVLAFRVGETRFACFQSAQPLDRTTFQTTFQKIFCET
ncbi:hypothetical protein NEIMUCOT_05022 [Neisseria mucosa ATCC 25996]|uniref:Uncharacterized protein n=1 Tax=Neisseria mucosa (strain ATCC 25996 / DSM 4631 / NCTC 10774 / M26) TaxID=546266 RepID=D2ZWM4_NEIM2|nr:hypothetical protein NEIMUCOT_05022 [Neisseria mucosa ATCC 25996]